MRRPINLERPGAPGASSVAERSGEGGRIALGEVGALLHFCARGPGSAGLEDGPVGLFVVSRPGATLAPGVYRYDPADHRLVPAADLGAARPGGRGDDEAPELTLLIGGDAPADEAARRLAASRMHRLALAAAELDLGPALDGPLLAGIDTGTVPHLAAEPLGLGRWRRDPAELARALLSGAHSRAASAAGRRLEAILEVSAARCRGPLVGGDAWTALDRLARHAGLPSRDVGLECRLAGGDHRVDLAAAFETRLWGAPTVADLTRNAGPTRGDWSLFDRFRRAHESSRELRRSTRHLGIELDADSPPPPLAAPGVFVGFDGGTLDRRVLRAAADGLAALLGPVSQRSLRDRFVDSLPDGAVLHYLGCFPSRQAEIARFNVEHPDRAAALAHLASLGFGADVAAAVEEAYGLGPRVVLAYDIGDGPVPRLGIELLFDDVPGSASGRGASPSMKAVLDRWVGQGLCSAAKAEALLAWPGSLQEGDADYRWPSPLAAAGRRSPGLYSVVFFSVSHLKLSVGVAEPEAKAYLQLRHVWVPDYPRPGRDSSSASRQSTVVNASDPNQTERGAGGSGPQ